MSTIFNDAPEYEPLHYDLLDIRDFIKNTPTSEIIDDIDSSTKNITIDLQVQTETGGDIKIKDLVVMKRIRSPRSEKDCTLNNIGVWENENCYVWQ